MIDPAVLWSCTTCGACVEECPVDIEHVDTILDMRRNQVLMDSSFPSEAARMLRNIEMQGDPWGIGGGKRLDWTEGLGFEVTVVDDTLPEGTEYLFWVGCAGAFDDRARRTTQSLARLLHRADVSFAVLGRGDMHRRPGPAARQRVPLPGKGGAEHRDAAELGRCEGRGQLRACFNTSLTNTRRWAGTSRSSITPSSSRSSSPLVASNLANSRRR